MHLVSAPGCSRNSATTGVRDFSSFSSSAANRGVSASRARIHRPTPPSGIASRNGIRQPQSVIACSPRIVLSSVTVSEASRAPPTAPICTVEHSRPRLRLGENSDTNEAAPPSSPPAAMP